MADPLPIADDEIILRHIPGGSRWQAPGPRITSGNFRLRHDRGETGISVTRRLITTPERLLSSLPTTAESRVAAALVRAIRDLGLEVVPASLEHDPGHSEIRSAAASLDDHLVRKQLANLFRLLDIRPTNP